MPRLLSEILSTRIMVKQAMKKLSPDQRVLQRVHISSNVCNSEYVKDSNDVCMDHNLVNHMM